MRTPKVCILRTAGTNCDRETAFAFEKAGASAGLVHVNQLVSGKEKLDDYQILAIPGGFSYGDDVAAGKVLANELRYKLADEFENFIADRKLIIGICNGFQILVKSGLLPGNGQMKQEASLIINDSGKFEDRWVHLKSSVVRRPSSVICVWAKNLPEVIYLPVAHGEGKFITQDKGVLDRLKSSGQIVFRYCTADGSAAGYPDNPNGSIEAIAGICDQTGRILGLMPHPERHISSLEHPRRMHKINQAAGDGLQIFYNGVDYIRRNFRGATR